MNHLAHLFLAQPTIESRVGNLLGDFARGVDLEALPVAVQRGVKNHWAVDTYTDQHPEVRASKALFSSRRRRFAGIALDVLYDHFLIAHWADFADHRRNAFVDDVYADLEQGQGLMPGKMARVVERMIRHDWFTAYADLQQIGFALDRVAERIRFRNNFEGAVEEIETHYEELEAGFLRFFPDLVTHVKNQAIEVPEGGLSGESWYWIRYNLHQH